MKLSDIVAYWTEQQCMPSGQWMHPLDEPVFEAFDHSFNLDFPVSPYVGNIVDAPVIILGSNAGYDPRATPLEFRTDAEIEKYVDRVRNPVEADWSTVAPYYESVNYGHLLASGHAALINACPYRSKKISAEPENRRLLDRLPSTLFARKWFLEAVVPLAKTGDRLVVAKRPGLWELPRSLRGVEGIAFDPAPVAPQITSKPWALVQSRLGISS